MEQIIDIIIKIVATLLLAGAGWLVKYVITYLRSNLSAKDIYVLNTFIAEMVAAAEQLYANDDPDGSVRRTYVQEMLVEAGYDITDSIMALVESKVYDINITNKAVKVGEAA